MAQRYDVRDNTGSTILPVADGDYTATGMSVDHEGGVFVIAFYDENDNVVTPDAGTIAVKMAPLPGSFGDASGGDTVINAAQTGAEFTYTIPSFLGPAVEGKITFAGISGATVDHAKAYFWRV